MSVLFLGSMVVPFFVGEEFNLRGMAWGGILTVASLWLSLRFVRVGERRGL